MNDMMNKSFEELPTEKFIGIKRKRIQENRIHELESNIQDDIESALHIAEHEIMRQHFDTIQGDDGEEDFFDSCFIRIQSYEQVILDSLSFDADLAYVRVVQC